MRMHHSLSPESDCGDARRDDLIAINSILNTPGALSLLWTLIEERREADAAWSKLFSREVSDGRC